MVKLLALILRRARQRILWRLDFQVLDGEERQAVLRLLWRLERHP